MFEDSTKGQSRWKFFVWPDVSDVEGADEAISFAYWCAFFVAGVTTVVALLGLLGAGLSSLVDAVIFALVGIGIRRRWRSAAVVGLVLFTLNLIVTLAKRPGVLPIVGIFVFFGFVAGVRGTYAYRRHTRARAAAGGEPPGDGLGGPGTAG